MRRHRSIVAKRYYSTSRMQTQRQGSTCRQAALTETDQLLPLLRCASAITTLGTHVLRRVQLQTRHPRGGKLWAPRKGRQRPDRSNSGQHRWRDSRIVPSAERHLQGTPPPDCLCDHPGRHFAPSVQVQISPEGPPGREGKGRSQRTAVNDLVMER